MEQEEPPGGAVALKQNSLKLNSDAVKKTKGPAQSPGPGPTMAPNPVQTQNLDLGQNHTPQTEENPPKDLQQSPAPVNGSTQSPGSEDPNQVQINDQEQHQTLVLTKPAGPGQSPSQSIVVRVPAMALLKALVQSTGQTQVRIPLQTQGPGPVLVPSMAPSHIHLTASVQSLTQSPGLIQNQVRSSGIIFSPTRTSGPGPGPAFVRPPGPSTNPVPSPGSAQNQVQVSQVQIQVRGPVQSPDPGLVQIALPPEAVRALSPPPTTTPLKPSVSPLGFRLNGRLIPLLPGVSADALEVSFRSHPRGSKSSLTSLHLKEAPPSSKRKAPPSNIKAPPLKRKAPPPSSSSAPFTGESAPATVTPPPAQVISHMPRPPTEPPKPRPHVTSAKPHPQKPRVATLLQKEEMTPAPPPDCTRCKSRFRPVPELRGFICMCSSEISSSLQTLSWRRKEERLKSKLKKLNVLKQRQKVSKPQPFHSSAASKSLSSLQKPLRAPGHFLSEPRPSAGSRPRPSAGHPSPSPGPSPSDRCSSAGVSVGGAVGRLVIRLEDFYYGSSEGHVGSQNRFITTYRCVQCNYKVHNNIRLMQHMVDHMTDGADFSCRYCFRQIVPRYKLQRHLEVVHGPNGSTVVCQICEREFETEIALLLHMKNTHKPGEMPYACESCGFRSSFFAQTWRHFEEVHADTKKFLCHFCLRVLKAERPYQQHMARHQRKQIYSCDRCRLHFLTLKDRQDHQDFLHGTHVRPAQLSGLRPGTTVTVRTFRVVPSDSATHDRPGPALAPSRIQRKMCKRKAVESLGNLLSQLDGSDSQTRCVECLSQFQDFGTHFPSSVSCSRCRFQTCCSRAYANHMINNHSSNRKRPLFPCVFTSCPSRGGALECLTCGFSSDSGDTMALHLSRFNKHTCLLLTGAELCAEGEGEEEEELRPKAGFVPLELVQNSPHLSIKVLNRPTHLSSPVAMTITTRGPAPHPKLPVSLSVSRLSVLLEALLLGVASAARRFGLSQALIGRWVREQKKGLANRRWRWDTGGGARWVLTEREQNRTVKPDAILDLSQRILGPKTSTQTRLNWAVDFLLRHDLGLETRSKELRDIGYSVVTSAWDKVSSLMVPPARFCCLDEFPVFLDAQALSSLSPDRLRVWGEREERPLVEVMLCGASNGSLLRPLLFYDKPLPPLPQGFPENVLLRGMDGGFSPSERATTWSREVWFPHLGCSSAPSVLLLDEHRGHMTEDFLRPLSCTELVHIPQGCGFVVQPLDQCVAPVVRQFLKLRWTQLVSQASCFSESDLVLTLGCWFSEVCHILNKNKQFIQRSFLCVGTRYKTAEVSHQSLNQDLHRVLVQTTPPGPCTGQSEGRMQQESRSETRDEHGSQSEALNEPEEAGRHMESQSEPEEEEKSQLKPQEEAGLRTESQSNIQEQEPEDQSEAQETEGAGLKTVSQSEDGDESFEGFE